MRPTLRTILLGLSVAAAVSACAAPLRAPAPIERGASARTASGQTSCGRSVTVQSGDTLYAIAQRCGVTLADLAAENGLREPYTLQRGQTVRLPGPSVYTVRRGDNLYRIALTHGMSTQELAQLNRLRQPYTIYPGQELTVNAHYHPSGKVETDRTRIALYFGEGEIQKEVIAALAGTMAFEIPPHAPARLRAHRPPMHRAFNGRCRARLLRLMGAQRAHVLTAFALRRVWETRFGRRRMAKSFPPAMNCKAMASLC